MKLTIEMGDKGLYNVIQTTDTDTKCLLSSSLENCIAIFKYTILNTSSPLNILYAYDDSTGLVLNYNTTPFKAIDGSTFANS